MELLTDIQMLYDLQASHRDNIHTQNERDTTYIHAGSLGHKCWYHVFLESKFGSLPFQGDPWTEDIFAWGVELEDMQEAKIFKAYPDWRLARVGKKGKGGRFFAKDDGTGRLSPTFRLDPQLNFGGSIDRLLVIPGVGRVPWEMKSISWRTPAGTYAGKVLWDLAVDGGHDIFGYMMDPPYELLWLRKWAYQFLAYLYLWKLPVGLFTILIKEVGRIIPTFVPLEGMDEPINEVLDKGKWIGDALKDDTVPIYKINDWTACKRCEYLQVCLPDIIKRDVTANITDIHHLQLIERYMELQENASEASSLWDEIGKLARIYLPQEDTMEQRGMRAGKYVINFTKKLIKSKKTVAQAMQELSGRDPTDPVRNPHYRWDKTILPAEETI
jgi:hypothetical protein